MGNEELDWKLSAKHSISSRGQGWASTLCNLYSDLYRIDTVQHRYAHAYHDERPRQSQSRVLSAEEQSVYSLVKTLNVAFWLSLAVTNSSQFTLIPSFVVFNIIGSNCPRISRTVLDLQPSSRVPERFTTAQSLLFVLDVRSNTGHTRSTASLVLLLLSSSLFQLRAIE